MIRNIRLLNNFEKEFIKNNKKISFQDNLKIFSALWQEGLTLGVLPPKNPLEGIETDIRIARIINSCLKKSSPK
jgi:hypothetical protein